MTNTLTTYKIRTNNTLTTHKILTTNIFMFILNPNKAPPQT